jgi:fluoroacetyl-CoA thioesterase
MKEIPPGTSEETLIEVTKEMAVPHLPIPMYSTPAMVGHFEGLCLRMLIPYHDEGETSVGFRVDVKHLAPTPVGQTVKITAKVREQDGRKIVFDVEAYNEGGTKIGEGMHERRAIDMTRFGGAKS